MYPNYSIWIILVIVFVSANLSFLSERMFAFSPMRVSNEPSSKSSLFYFVRFLIWLSFFLCAAYLSSNVLLDLPVRVAGLLIMVVCFVIPGIATRKHVQFKNIFINLYELIFFLIFVGSVGFFIEGYYANSVPLGWQFYAVGICIFLLMAFPGFVWRHLMNHPHLPKHKLQQEV